MVYLPCNPRPAQSRLIKCSKCAVDTAESALERSTKPSAAQVQPASSVLRSSARHGMRHAAGECCSALPARHPPLCEHAFSMLFFKSFFRIEGLKPMLVPLNS